VTPTSEQKTDFRVRFGELLKRAQAAGAVRADIERDDLPALLSGYVAIRRQSPADRLLGHIITDGLRS
jgi:hypothetical protein